MDPFRCWLFQNAHLIKKVSLALIALGAVLILAFVPMEFWLALLGIILLLWGLLLLRM